MIKGLLIALAASFIGSLGFAVLLQAPKKSLVAGAAIGAVSYALYWLLLYFGVSELLAMFAGAAVGSDCILEVAAPKNNGVTVL